MHKKLIVGFKHYCLWIVILMYVIILLIPDEVKLTFS